MRVVVATDAMAGLSPREASETIAHAFADLGAQVAVVPLGYSGEHLAEAVAAAAPAAAFEPAPGIGEVAAALGGDAQTLVLDLTGAAIEGLDAIAPLAAARAAWQGREIVALVPAAEVDRPLTGLNGHASTVLRAAGAGLDEILAFDAAAEQWAAELGVTPGPGAGAAGGLGLVLQHLSARIVDPLTWLAEQFGLARTLEQCDLAITGAELLDFHSVGGPVVGQLVAWAEEAVRPVIAIAGRSYISARELRLAGLESVHALLPGAGGEGPTPEDLARTSARLAATWIRPA